MRNVCRGGDPRRIGVVREQTPGGVDVRDAVSLCVRGHVRQSGGRDPQRAGDAIGRVAHACLARGADQESGESSRVGTGCRRAAADLVTGWHAMFRRRPWQRLHGGTPGKVRCDAFHGNEKVRLDGAIERRTGCGNRVHDRSLQRTAAVERRIGNRRHDAAHRQHVSVRMDGAERVAGVPGGVEDQLPVGSKKAAEEDRSEFR